MTGVESFEAVGLIVLLMSIGGGRGLHLLNE